MPLWESGPTYRRRGYPYHRYGIGRPKLHLVPTNRDLLRGWLRAEGLLSIHAPTDKIVSGVHLPETLFLLCGVLDNLNGRSTC